MKQERPDESINISLVRQPRKLKDLAGLRTTISLVRGSPTIIFNEARKTTENGGDGTWTHIPVLGKAVVVESYKAGELIFRDGKAFTRSSSVTKVVENLLGGEGPLTTGGNDAGASAVTDRFGAARLRESQDFMDSLVENQKAFLGDFLGKKDQPFDHIVKERNIEFMTKTFFNDKITTKEMETVYDYVKSIFGSVLFLAPLKMTESKLKIFPHLERKRVRGNKILDNLINNRLENPSQNEAESDLLDFVMKRKKEPQRTEEMSDREYQRQHKKWMGEIRSTMYQIIFAGLETTDAGLSFISNYLAKPENFQEQDKLRVHAKNFLAKKGDQKITFNDFNSNDPDMEPFLTFVDKILRESGVTPIDLRTATKDVKVSNGIIKRGTAVIIDISNCAVNQFNSAPPGHKPKNLDDLKNSIAFGEGQHFCKGAYFALSRMILNTMIVLGGSNHIEHSSNSRPKLESKSTQRIKGIRLNIT